MSFTDWGKRLDSQWRDLEERMRAHPDTFILGSLALGFLIQILPIRTLIISIVRLTLFLAKPALVFWFGYRLYQWLEHQTKVSRNAQRSGVEHTHSEASTF
jgi:hypothetical protein